MLVGSVRAGRGCLSQGSGEPPKKKAPMGFKRIIREVAEGMMPGGSTQGKSDMLDKAVKEGRLWVEVTDAGIELYTFPQADRSKGGTLTEKVSAEERGKVSDAVHRAATGGFLHRGQESQRYRYAQYCARTSLGPSLEAARHCRCRCRFGRSACQSRSGTRGPFPVDFVDCGRWAFQ